MTIEQGDAVVFKPGDMLGIIGGGQLGRMLAMAAARFGFHTTILEPAENCPAAQVANRHIPKAYDDKDALAELAASCKAVTYEFENIPHAAAAGLQENCPLFPDAEALKASQDRIAEKDFLNANAIETAKYHPVETLQDLAEASRKLAAKTVLKTRRMGYDGKGQARLGPNPSEEELISAWDAVGQSPSVLEGFVDFEREISVIIARAQNGETRCYDPGENVHVDGILHTTTLPANISGKCADEAKSIAEKIATSINYVGVMGVEFFVGKEETLYVNEIAPRVHNSGHWTEAACLASQFEQHIRAVCGLPLADPHRHSDCQMENLIGDDVEQLPELVGEPHTLVHLYGKSEARPGRKMGHFTRLKVK